MGKKAKKETGRNPLEIVADLQVLIATPGWAIILEQIERNIEALNEMILNKTDDGRIDGNPIDDRAVDQLRYKRGYLIELRDFPQNYISKLQENTEEPEDYDPYFKSAKEIIASRRKK